MSADLKKYSVIKIDGCVSKNNNEEFTGAESDQFFDDFIVFIESKNLMFGGGFGGVTKEDEEAM